MPLFSRTVRGPAPLGKSNCVTASTSTSAVRGHGARSCSICHGGKHGQERQAVHAVRLLWKSVPCRGRARPAMARRERVRPQRVLCRRRFILRRLASDISEVAAWARKRTSASWCGVNTCGKPAVQRNGVSHEEVPLLPGPLRPHSPLLQPVSILPRQMCRDLPRASRAADFGDETARCGPSRADCVT